MKIRNGTLLCNSSFLPAVMGLMWCSSGQVISVQHVHHTFVPMVASLGKISKFPVIVMDADGVTWVGASRGHSGALAAPITFVRWL